MSDAVGANEFAQRLVALCIGGSSSFPKRARDLHILLASATLWLESGAVYSETEVNEALRGWLATACPSLRIDEVTLRRELVDNLYLLRDDSGSHYSPGPGPAEWRFEPDIASLDPGSIIQAALAEREERRIARAAMAPEARPPR